jgi:hypothetical protein
VLTAHGMSYACGAQLLLPQVLARLGVASLLPPRDTRSRGERAMASLGRRLPRPVRSSASSLRARVAGRAGGGLPTIPVDLEQSDCFPVANGLMVGGVRLNLARREPHGTLVDADGFCVELAGALLEIVDERTGQAAIRSVVRTEDVYEGERLFDLPDLLVEWADDVPTGSVTVGTGEGADVVLSSPRIGTVAGTNRWSRSGEHRRDGLFVAAGPGIPAGPVGRDVDLLDVAPTLCALLGVELSTAEGVPIGELVGDEGAT